MRLRGVRGSRNIEDRRRSGGGGRAGIGGVGLLVVLAIGYFAGIDVTPLLQQATQPAPASRELSAEEVPVKCICIKPIYGKDLLHKIFYRGCCDLYFVMG